MQIETGHYSSPSSKHLEVVERKGIGHPDTVADQLAEITSIAFATYCVDTFGYPLAHNVDKIGVMGGKSYIDYGIGRLEQPIRVLLNGRLTRDFAGQEIPVRDIAFQAMKTQLGKALPELNVDTQVRFIDESTDYSKYTYKFHPRGVEDVPELQNAYASDTVAVVATYPNTPAENTTLALEGFFYDQEGKPKFRDVGQDIKVMVRRIGQDYKITLCVPFFAKDINSEDTYWTRRDEVEKQLFMFAQELLPKANSIELFVNTQDNFRNKRNEPRPARGLHLVTTGGALDYGEEGFVGRGNNRHGIIPSMRSYTMEAPYGKNPKYHAGKVLAVVADSISLEVGKKFECETEVWIMPNNSDPLLQPSFTVVNTSLGLGREEVEPIVCEVLSRNDWLEMIVYNQLFLPTAGGRK